MHVYVTKYPKFFNEVDPDCDKTTFYFWEPRYDPKPDSSKYYLTTDLRSELNGLVGQLNDLIADAVDAVNAKLDSPQVHVVDPNPKFDHEHHWCEEGDFHEPYPDREDTWFFLSGWPDVSIYEDALWKKVEATEDVSSMRNLLR
jgi:hypothetical protein